MASLSAVGAVSSPSQNLAAPQLSVSHVAVPGISSSASPCHKAVPRNVLYASSSRRPLGDGISLDFSRALESRPRRKLSADRVRHTKSGGGSRTIHSAKCMSATSVVQEVSSAKVLEDNLLDMSASLSSKPAVLDENETSEDSGSESDGLVLRPAPKPSARPQRSAEQSQGANADMRAGNGGRSAPGAQSGKREDTDTTFKVVFRPGEQSTKAGGSEGTNDSPVDSLGGILEKAEKLELRPGKENRSPQSSRSSPSVWRKGDSIDVGGPNLVLKRSGLAPAEETAGGTSNGSEATTSASSSPLVRSKPLSRPELPTRAPLKLTLKPPSKEVAVPGTPVRRQPILKDVGATKKLAPSKDSAANMKSKSADATAATSIAAAAVAPTKFGKAAPAKGKDGKEDWRKKSISGTDGPKRRVASRGKADDATDMDASGASATARRSGRKMTKASRKAARAEAAKAAAPVRVDILEVGKQGMSVPDLAQKLAVNDSEIVKTLFMKGIFTTVNQTLDEDTVKLVCQEYEVEVVEAGFLKVEDMARKTRDFLDEEDLDHLVVRPPVVTIMGHVDHGKTSLLDYIRQSKVAASEAGGITQGIGAYRVLVPVDGELQPCVFLDTPGHEAFSAMRARGARVTDIAIVVVAADDGVRPQTQEAIAHARAASVPIVVAINKIDKDGAEPERVMQELASLGLLPEDWGGDVPMVQVSALKGQNVDTLLETVMLVAEFQDLKANPSRNARGTVIEACLDKTKGAVATLLVQNGTLRKGDVVLCGQAYGKVRALLDDTGARVDEAGPSTAVQVIGLSNVPVAGDDFEAVNSLDVAREKAEQCAQALRISRLVAQAGEGKVTLSSLASTIAESQETGVERHQLNVVLKVDVQGSVEAIREALQVLPQDTVNLRFLMQAPGDISASDIDLAIASEAVVVGFNVAVQSDVQTYAENNGVEIRMYRVIYELIDDIRSAMEGMLDPFQERVPVGKAEVRAIFSSGSGKVAGCMVTEGKLMKGCGVQIMRGGAVIHTSTLDSLRRVKELAKEVVAGLECGIGVNNFNEWQENDTVEAFNMADKKRSLEEASTSTAAAVAAAGMNATKSL